MSTLGFRDVTVRYGRRVAVDAASATAAAGEWVGLIGPNGAGKSSLLKAAVAVVRYRGTITVDGVDLAGLDRHRRARTVAYVPQSPELPADMSGLDYTLLGRSPHIGYFAMPTEHDRAIARDVLARLDLVDFAERPLGAMSGGERQRVVLARSLATEAPVLLLDEATSALDVGHQQQALDLVDALRREHGLTVVSALHDLTLAGSYCDRLVLFDQGRIAATGHPTEVLTTDLLAAHYGARVSVEHQPDGTVSVRPVRR